MKKTYFALVVTMLVVGFAAVTTNLVMNGVINFGFNQPDFDSNIVFTYTNTMHGSATIEDDGKIITFKTTKLENVDQQAIMDFDIANKSSQYDATVTIQCGLNEDYISSYEQYIDISQNLGNSFELISGATQTGRLTITLKKAYNESLEKEINMSCKIEATPKTRTTEGKYVPVEHQYEEILLNGANPVLETEQTEAVSLATETNEKKLIPVTIEENGLVKRADTTKEWYDYESQQWANAVILIDGVDEPEVEDEIPEKNIESYFVWIPKYKYRLWNVDTDNPAQKNPFSIEIVFGTEDTEDNENECVAPNKSGESNECENGKWMTHPAFTSFGVNGFWVGKFETGYKQNDDLENMTSWTKEGAEKDEQDSSKIIVKPNVYSWRKVTNEKIFNSLKGYSEKLDSHMMKNTEWGAVAILSHSIYGINTEVTQNTNPSFLTGYTKNDSDSVSYPNSSAFSASTTGNITGIYDMSGGAWERMAAYRDTENNEEQIGESEFTKQEIAAIEGKYFDVYKADSDQTTYKNRILGDATGEMSPFNNQKGNWYEDWADFIDDDAPWFGRGSNYSDTSGYSGQFGFGRNTGEAEIYNSSRLVLSPKE